MSAVQPPVPPAEPSADNATDCPAGAPGGVSLDRIRVVLSHPSHPGNIGATARAMKTMGLSRLYLVNPREFPSPEATSRSSGATDVLDHAVVCGSLNEALHGTLLAVALSARSRELVARVTSAREAAAEAVAMTANGEVALVFGTEMFGLTNDEVGRCGLLCYIPANPAYSSLNLAAAVQVLSYECRVAAEEAGAAASGYAAPSFPAASQDAVEGFYAHLEKTMIDLEFLDPRMPKRLMPRLRRLFGRTGLEKEEVNILRGLLASIDRGLARTEPGREP